MWCMIVAVGSATRWATERRPHRSAIYRAVALSQAGDAYHYTDRRLAIHHSFIHPPLTNSGPMLSQRAAQNEVLPGERERCGGGGIDSCRMVWARRATSFTPSCARIATLEPLFARQLGENPRSERSTMRNSVDNQPLKEFVLTPNQAPQKLSAIAHQVWHGFLFVCSSREKVSSAMLLCRAHSPQQQQTARQCQRQQRAPHQRLLFSTWVLPRQRQFTSTLVLLHMLR